MNARVSARLDTIRVAVRHPAVGGLAVAALHYVAFWAFFLFGMSLGMSDFDEGPTFSGLIGRLLLLVSYVLGIPLGSVLLHFSRGTSPAQQHAILALNSLLWGGVAALALLRVRHRGDPMQPSA